MVVSDHIYTAQQEVWWNLNHFHWHSVLSTHAEILLRTRAWKRHSTIRWPSGRGSGWTITWRSSTWMPRYPPRRSTINIVTPSSGSTFRTSSTVHSWREIKVTASFGRIIYSFIYLYIFSFNHSFVRWLVCPSVCPFVCPCVRASVRPSARPSVRLTKKFRWEEQVDTDDVIIQTPITTMLMKMTSTTIFFIEQPAYV